MSNQDFENEVIMCLDINSNLTGVFRTLLSLVLSVADDDPTVNCDVEVRSDPQGGPKSGNFSSPRYPRVC